MRLQNLYIAATVILVWVGSLLFAQHVVAPHEHNARLDSKAQSRPGRSERRPVPEEPANIEHGQSRGPIPGSSIPVRAVESSNEEKRREEKERRSEQREEDDLNAQRGMAKSAKDAVFIAWWQVAIGLIGAVLLGASLIYSARAAKASAVAAKAAEEVLKAERAWMTVVETNHELHSNLVVPVPPSTRELDSM
jgi:hypothetical protein